MPEGG